MILLASKSPRRQELLSGLGIEYQIVNVDCDESYPQNLKEADIPMYLAKLKATNYQHQLQPDDILITADTIVWLDNTMLGKPKNQKEAKKMLQLLSGKTHQVFTAVCLTTKTNQIEFVDRTDVTFRKIKKSEIEYYVANYNTLDKAGAYGIQDWLGYALCSNINGSFYNVMGLPTQRLYEELSKFKKN